MRRLLCITAMALGAAGARAELRIPQPALPASQLPATCSAEAGWDEPMPPRQVFGNTWYVGSCGITALLIATPQGHVLLDGGAKNGAALINANLKALGVRIQDVRHIAVSHAHFDHVGGVAALQAASGATVWGRDEAVATMRRGKSDRSDPQFDDLDAFPPVKGARVMRDGGVLQFGGLRLRNIPMPGHAPGGSGWTWQSCEGTRCLQIVYSDSVSAISDGHYRFDARGSLAQPLRKTLDTLAKARCDILLTTHTPNSNLLARLDGKAPLVDATACAALARNFNEALDKRLRDEAAGLKP